MASDWLTAMFSLKIEIMKKLSVELRNIWFPKRLQLVSYLNVAVSLGVGRSSCDTISLGQGQGPIAAKLIAKVKSKMYIKLVLEITVTTE